MWIGERTIDEIIRRSAWNVEFFARGERRAGAPTGAAVKLREIVRERRKSIDPQSEPDRLFHYLSLENVEGLTGDLIGFTPKLGREIRSRSKCFAAGDVLYGRLRPALNKVYVAAGTVTSGICSGEFYVLVPDPARVVPLYLRTLLASDLIQPILVACSTGSALPRIGLEDLLELTIPLPPLPLQRRLAVAVARDGTRRRKMLNLASELPKRWMKEFLAALE